MDNICAVGSRLEMDEDAASAFRDAGVLMEMADYAERNSLSHPAAKLQLFRSAALQLRCASARAMIKRLSFR